MCSFKDKRIYVEIYEQRKGVLSVSLGKSNETVNSFASGHPTIGISF